MPRALDQQAGVPRTVHLLFLTRFSQRLLSRLCDRDCFRSPYCRYSPSQAVDWEEDSWWFKQVVGVWKQSHRTIYPNIYSSILLLRQI
jgi:hypothetical protein